MRVGKSPCAKRMDTSEIVIAAASLILSLGLWTGRAGAEGLNTTGLSSLMSQDEVLELAPVNQRYKLPVHIEKATGLFVVDTVASELVLSREFIAANKLWDYHFIREVSEGDLVEFKSVRVGKWTLNDVQAVICDACTLLAGKSVLNQFHLESIERGGVEYVTLRR